MSARSARVSGRLAILLVLALLLVLSVRRVEDPDVGFHLRSGEDILSGRSLPETDRITYTRGNQPDIDLYWLYPVSLVLIQRGLDAPGLVALHALLILLTFLTLYRTARLDSADRLSLAGLLLLGILASELRFEVRPEVVSYLFLAVILYLLERRAHSLPFPLWLLPLLHLVWANLHGFFIAGWGVLACYLAGGALRNRRLDLPLAGWSLASVAACVVNPYGLRGWLFPLTLAGRLGQGDIFRQTIGEMASPFALRLTDQYPFFPRFPVLCFQLFTVLALGSLPILLRRRRFERVFVTAVFLIPAVSMLRNMPLLVVTALPSIAMAGEEAKRWLSGFLSPQARRRLWPAAMSALMAVTCGLALRVYHDSYYIAGRRPTRFGWGWNHISLPFEAVEFARRAGLTGRVFNHLNLGGTLAWKLPQPLFIHAHLEAVGADFYRQYLECLASEEALEASVQRYGIEWAIYPYSTHPDLLSRMSRDSRWKLAYADPLAVIFVRADSPSASRVDADLAAGRGARLSDSDLRSLPGLGTAPRDGWLHRWMIGFFRREIFPTEDLNLGLFHFYRGELVRAGGRFARGIRESNGAYYELFANLAPCLYSQKRYQEGMACDRAVLEDDPHNRLARERLEF